MHQVQDDRLHDSGKNVPVICEGSCKLFDVAYIFQEGKPFNWPADCGRSVRERLGGLPDGTRRRLPALGSISKAPAIASAKVPAIASDSAPVGLWLLLLAAAFLLYWFLTRRFRSRRKRTLSYYNLDAGMSLETVPGTDEAEARKGPSH